MKIMIIEDEIELLISISNFLTRENFICDLAEDFARADDKVVFYEYGIILLDITLQARLLRLMRSK